VPGRSSGRDQERGLARLRHGSPRC
jgi:hypothetical protein